MNTQIFDQIEMNVTTLEFTLYINILGIQEQFSITHSKAQYLIESVRMSDKYTMNVELSTLFVRDQNNNAIDGVLNLRTITTRHKKTGNYDISVSNRSRTPVISSFTNQVVGDNENLLQLSNYEEEGEFVTNVLSYSDSTSLKITSDYPTPVNIVNIEVKGKFIQKYTSLNT